MTNQKKTLFNDFRSFSQNDWLKLIKQDFPEKTIADFSWKSPEQIEIDPFYTKNENEYGATFNSREWFVQESYNQQSFVEVLKSLEIASSNGIRNFRFDFDYLKNGIYGLPLTNPDDLNEIIRSENQTNYYHFNGCGIQSKIFELLNQINNFAIYGSVQFDPYFELLTQSDVTFNFDKSIQTLADFLVNGSDYHHLKKLVINGTHFKSAAADCVSEISWTLSTLIDYLAGLTDLGFSIDQLATELTFNLSIGSNFFFEIAKFRAFRILVAQILSDYGLKTEKNIDICALSGDWNKSIFDPHTNLLRTTTEAMSAVIGGANRIELSRFDHFSQTANQFSQRMARNIQFLLKSESHLDFVADPATGSYYIESLTDQMISKSWEKIKTINNNGGFFDLIKSGKIQSELETNLNKISKLLSEEKVILVGINKFQQNNAEKVNPTQFISEYPPNFDLPFKSHPLKNLKKQSAEICFEEPLA